LEKRSTIDRPKQIDFLPSLELIKEKDVVLWSRYLLRNVPVAVEIGRQASIASGH
jgi:hypothetical protein